MTTRREATAAKAAKKATPGGEGRDVPKADAIAPAKTVKTGPPPMPLAATAGRDRAMADNDEDALAGGEIDAATTRTHRMLAKGPAKMLPPATTCRLRRLANVAKVATSADHAQVVRKTAGRKKVRHKVGYKKAGRRKTGRKRPAPPTSPAASANRAGIATPAGRTNPRPAEPM